MSAYAVLADLTTFGLTSDTLSTIDPNIQTRHLSAASGFIDSYLNARFILPLKTWDDSLIQKCCEIAAGNLLTIRGYDPENEADRSIYTRFENAKAWLEDIKQGNILPVVTDSSSSSGDQSVGGSSTLQMSTEAISTQATTGATKFNQQVDSTGAIAVIGAPRQRGWR